MFTKWEDLSRRDQLLSEISDTHKSAYGVRYRGNVDHMTDADLEQMLDRLYDAAHEECKHQEEMQDLAVDRFEKLINDTIMMGAMDRATAIRWIKEAEGDDYWDVNHDSKSFQI